MTQAQTKDRDEFEHAKGNAAGWLSSIEDMLQAWDEANDDEEGGRGREDKLEEAKRTIEESVLTVQIRDGWHSPGVAAEGAEEYEILLTTGGPALRILGRLNQFDEPDSAELQMQDWGTPWTRYPAPEATLLKFAQHFWFGG